MSLISKRLSKFVCVAVLLVVVSLLAKTAYASVPFTNAYNTFTNSRFSFKGSLSVAIANGTGLGTISGSGFTDNDTGNLFNGDTICFNGNTGNGCVGSATYTVNNIASTTAFGFTPVLVGTTMIGDSVLSTQSGQMTITFKPATSVPSGAHLILSVPSAATNFANGIPDSTGFDAAALPADLTAGTCAAGVCFSASGFTASAVALTTAATNHTVNITLSSALVNTTTYTFTLGHASNATLRFLNPTPSGTSHTRGVADSYTFVLTTKDSGQTITYDSTNMKVAPIDGVFVSANVELSISYTINDSSNGYGGNIAGSTAVTQCSSFTTSVATTATTVPFGSILNFDAFYKAAQSHYVVTNASNGYVLSVFEDGPLTSGANNIPNGTCDGACTSSSNAAWGTPGNNGLGYQLGGTDVAFSGATFKIFPQTAATAETIMSKASQTAGSRGFVCYQLSVDVTQPDGLYYNKLTYVATPKF